MPCALDLLELRLREQPQKAVQRPLTLLLSFHKTPSWSSVPQNTSPLCWNEIRD